MKRDISTSAISSFAVLIATFASGCAKESDGLPREAVEIEATIDSKPIEKAFVQLLPAQQAEAVTHVGGILENGRLSIAKDTGPVPGEYLVSLTSG